MLSFVKPSACTESEKGRTDFLNVKHSTTRVWFYKFSCLLTLHVLRITNKRAHLRDSNARTGGDNQAASAVCQHPVLQELLLLLKFPVIEKGRQYGTPTGVSITRQGNHNLLVLLSSLIPHWPRLRVCGDIDHGWHGWHGWH
jgi:hypothetical protein